MKKLSKVLYAFLAISLCFTITLPLSACKSKKKNEVDNNTYMSNAQILKILSSAEWITANTGSEPQTDNENLDSANKDIVVTNNDSYLNSIYSTTEVFSEPKSGHEATGENDIPFTVKNYSKDAIAIARNLVSNNITDFYNNVVEYSFSDKTGYNPSNITYRLKLTVSTNSLILMYNDETLRFIDNLPDETFASNAIIQLIFDENLSVTKINYATVRNNTSTVASYDVDANTVTFIPADDASIDYAYYKAIIGQKINEFKAEKTTKNSTDVFFRIYFLVKSGIDVNA